MTGAFTVRDEHAGATSNRYQYTRIVEIAGRTVRANIERDFYLDQSLAVAEVLNDRMTWTSLAADAQSNWWHTTPSPNPDVDAAAVLGPLAERLLRRAAEILASPPTTSTVSPHVHRAISALLVTCYGFDAECRIGPNEIAWARTHGGALHIIEHPDGTVTFTKAHRDECPFITSKGGCGCDDECSFDFPHRAENRATER